VTIVRTSVWKWLGVAGIAGVAATGAALAARGERERRAYTPEDIRARLHDRAVQLRDDETGTGVTGTAPRTSG
jgi:hypothetical protein